MPTVAPSADSASARLIAVVDLPTPPLPEATASTFLMFSIGLRFFCTECAWIAQPTSTSMRAPPSSCARRASTARAISSRIPLAG